MARITYVKAAQQRFKQIPVIDPETGQQKRTPVMTKNGQQKTDKRGKPVFLRVTQADRDHPLPNRHCDKCGKEIEVGQPYKHISPRSGPYGGRTLYRCAECPSWHVWEYSSSLSARTAQISYDFSEALSSVEDPDDVRTALGEAAEAIREIASEKAEGADNMESGFGHETERSAELRETGESLEAWADEVENCDVPDLPEVEEGDCEECEGSGVIPNPDWDDEVEDQEAEIACDTCDGTGRFTPDEPTSDQMDEWRSEVTDACSIVDECPV
jgi:hypothetical protein